MEKKTYIDKVTLIHIKDKKILMAKSKGKDRWFTPGGKREGEETDTATLIREIKEELSVTIDPATIRYYGTVEDQAWGKPEGTMIRLSCYTADHAGTLQPNGEIERIDYLSYKDKPMTTATGQLIFDELKAKGLLE